MSKCCGDLNSAGENLPVHGGHREEVGVVDQIANQRKSVRDKCRIRIAVFVFSSGTLSGYLGLGRSI